MNAIRSILSWLGNIFCAKPEEKPPVNRCQTPQWRKLRQEVWRNYFNEAETGKCYACGIVVQRRNRGWHCSHVKPHSKGGPDKLENLRVCCGKCNLSMGTENLYAYILRNNLSGPGRTKARDYCHRHNISY